VQAPGKHKISSLGNSPVLALLISLNFKSLSIFKRNNYYKISPLMKFTTPGEEIPILKILL
jgi:hypothetical protein